MAAEVIDLTMEDDPPVPVPVPVLRPLVRGRCADASSSSSDNAPTLDNAFGQSKPFSFSFSKSSAEPSEPEPMPSTPMPAPMPMPAPAYLPIAAPEELEAYHLIEFSDMFQPLHELPHIVHDATEDALRLVVTALPAGRVWEENTSAAIPSYDIDLQIPQVLMTWRRVTIPAPRHPTSHAVRLPCSDAIQTTRLLQALSDEIKPTIELPVSKYPNWSNVRNLHELERKVAQAQQLNRMLMVVCSKQNESFWLPNAFHQWAPKYPRLMFASIDRDAANRSGSDHLRKQLLGFEEIDGLCFVSHVPGEPECRAFNASKISTADIHTSLMTRYRVSCADHKIPPLEKNALRSCLQVNWAAALKRCCQELSTEPLQYAFAFRLEEISKQAIEDMDALIPAGGFAMRTNHTFAPIEQPKQMLLPLLDEQLRSIAWMQYREQHAFQSQGVILHSAKITVPPFHDLSLQFKLSMQYTLRGGVLADCIGFGKTACVLGLIASSPVVPYAAMHAARRHEQLIPSRATLIVVPSHLVHQWAGEVAKFLIGQRVLTISRVTEVPSVGEMITADIIIVSNTLFDSEVYQAQYLHADLQSLRLELSQQTRAQQLLQQPAAKKRGKAYRAPAPVPAPAFVATGASAEEKMDTVRRYYLQSVQAAVDVAKEPGNARILYNNPDMTITGPSTKKARKAEADAVHRLPLEAFFWQRLVIDEMHELVTSKETSSASSSKDSMTSLGVRCLSAYARWGLTATPPVDSLKSIDSLSHLLHLNTGSTDIACAEQLVAHCFSSSQRNEQAFPQPIERQVFVPLTAHELVIYRQTKYDLQHQQVKQAQLMEELLLQASHFALRGLNRRAVPAAAGIENELDTIRRTKRQRIEVLTVRKTDTVRVLDLYNRQLAALNEDMNSPEHVRRQKLTEILGRKEEIVDSLKEINIELHALQTSLDFFDQTLKQLKEGRSLPDCPICLEKMEFGAACMSVCGHMQCVECAIKVATEMKACATCRAPLGLQQWKVLHEVDLEEPLELGVDDSGDGSPPKQDNTVATIEKADDQYMTMGSKMAFLVTQIHAILQADPEARILVYCQWNTLKMKLREAFDTAHLAFATLEGHADILREVLKRFTDRTAAKTINILLCSLEAKAAGLNLQAAQHIIFVHPFFSLSEVQAAAWEAQAIGRVLRPGQTKVVNIWRFVSLQTIDQEIIVRRQMAAWKEHFKRSGGGGLA